MSIEVSLSVWPRPEQERDPATVVTAALRAVETANAPDDEPIFLHVRVNGKGDDIRLKRDVESSNAEEVASLIAPYLDEMSSVHVDCAWDALENDGSRVRTEKRPLTVNHYSPGNGYKGHTAKSWGTLRIDFYTTKSFWIRRNFEWPLGIARTLIGELDPLHVMIYTDLEVNPLTAHALYHRDIADFASDIREFARLHDFGGAYRATEEPGQMFLRAPWTMPGDYGMYREDEDGSCIDIFNRRIAPLLAMGRLGDPASELTHDAIDATLSDLQTTRAERIGRGLLLTAHDAPFAYLEEPFFRLQEAAARARHA